MWGYSSEAGQLGWSLGWSPWLPAGAVGLTEGQSGEGGTSPEGSGVAVGGPGIQLPGIAEGLPAVGGRVRLGVPAPTGFDPVALGGGTLSPPTESELPAGLAFGDGAVAVAVAVAVEAGPPGPEGPAAPQAARRRLMSAPATAVARLAGISLLRCDPVAP